MSTNHILRIEHHGRFARFANDGRDVVSQKEWGNLFGQFQFKKGTFRHIDGLKLNEYQGSAGNV